MKILFWSFYDPSGTGGFEKQALATIRSMMDADHEFACITTTAANDVLGCEMRLRETELFSLGIRVFPRPTTSISLGNTFKFWGVRHPSSLIARSSGGFLARFESEFNSLIETLAIQGCYCLSLRSTYFLADNVAVPTVVDLVDSYSLKYRRRIAFHLYYGPIGMPAAIIEWLKTRRLEQDVGRRFSRRFQFIFVSPADTAHFGELSPLARVAHVPIPFEVKPFQVGAEGVTRDSLLLTFYGHLYTEFNLDAAIFLAERIMPLVRQLVRGVRLEIGGVGMPLSLRKRVEQFSWIKFVEPVSSIPAFAGRSTVACWPFRFGSGIKTKILESLALEHAVVTTSHGVEPFADADRSIFCVHDDPQSLARAVADLINDPVKTTELGAAGRRLVSRAFAPAIKANAVSRMLTSEVRE